MPKEIIFNPGHARRRKRHKRRGLRHNPFGGSHRRHRRKHSNRHHRRRHTWNPFGGSTGASIAAPQPTLMTGFKPSSIGAAAPVLTGLMLSSFANKMVAPKLGPKFASGIANIGLGLGTAGAIGVLGSFVSKQVGGQLALGAIAEVLARVLNQFDMNKPNFGLFGFGSTSAEGWQVASGGLGSTSAEGWEAATGGMGAEPEPIMLDDGNVDGNEYEGEELEII